MRFAVFDTETTGLTVHYQAELWKQPRIIEFGGIITDGVEILDELSFICNPEQPIEEVITKITGLTNDDLEDKYPFRDFIPQVKDFFSKADVAIAHNCSFDKNLLKYDLQRESLKLSDVAWPKIELCTVEQTFDQFGRRMKLEELYNMYIGEFVQTHRALDDVKLLHAVCQKIGVYSAFKVAA